MSGLKGLGSVKNEAADEKAESAANEARKTVEEANDVPAFGKHGGGADENEPLTESGQVEANQNQSGAASADPEALTEIDAVVADLAETAESDGVIYTSHPVLNYRLGDYQFTNGQLTLTPEEAARFDELVSGLPILEQNSIRKIDVAGAHEKARAFVQSQMNRGVDTTANTDTSSKD